MAKMRVHELAKECNVNSKDILSFLAEKKVEVKTASSAVEEAVADMVMKHFGNGASAAPEAKAEKAGKAEPAAKAEPVQEKPQAEAGKTAKAPEQKAPAKAPGRENAPADRQGQGDPVKKKKKTIIIVGGDTKKTPQRPAGGNGSM